MVQVFKDLLRLAPPTAPVIGADLARDGVRLLQVETAVGRQPRVIAAARRDLRPEQHPEGQTVVSDAALEALADLLRRGDFRGRRVVAAVPRGLVQYKTLRLTTTGSEDLPRQLAREAQSAMGVDLTTGEHVVHFLPGDTLRRGSETHQEGILVVLRKQDVEQYVARLHWAGAEVGALDLEPLSLYRSLHRFQRRKRDAQDVQVIVEMNERSTQVIIGRAGRVSFLKSISIGTHTIYAGVGRKLALSQDEAEALCKQLATKSPEHNAPFSQHGPLERAVYGAARAILEDLGREVSLCLRYYGVTFKCRRPERVLVCGLLAADEQWRSALAAEMPVPLEARRPLEDLMIPASRAAVLQERQEEWTRALGLALRFAPAGLAGRAGLTRETQALADQRPGDDLEGPLRTLEPDEPVYVSRPQSQGAFNV